MVQIHAWPVKPFSWLSIQPWLQGHTMRAAVLLGAGLRVEHIHRLSILNVSTLPQQQHIDTKSNHLNLIPLHSHNQGLVHESNHGSSAALGPCHADTSPAGEQSSIRGLGRAQLHLVGGSLGKTSSCNLREIRNFSVLTLRL